MLRGGQSRTALQVRYIRVSEGGEGDGGREELSKREARGGGEQTHLNRSCSHLLVYNVRTDAFNDNMCTDLKALASEQVLCNAVHP